MHEVLLYAHKHCVFACMLQQTCSCSVDRQFTARQQEAHESVADSAMVVKWQAGPCSLTTCTCSCLRLPVTKANQGLVTVKAMHVS